MSPLIKVTFNNVDNFSAHGGIVVTLDKTDGLRTVTVTYSIPGISLFSNSRSVVGNTYTSSDGAYTFTNLEPGTYTIYATSSYSSERAVFINVVVRAGETTIADVLQLTATGCISGTITTDGYGSGNSGYLVFVAGTSYISMTDESGKYTISGIPAGNGYQIVATKNGVIHNLSSWVTVTANETVTLSTDTFTSTEIINATKGEKGENGATGENGIDGKDGISIVWIGAFDSEIEIENPEYLNAYFNKTDGCSYIYNGTDWSLLARSGVNGADGKDGIDGKDGTGIVWLGSYSSFDFIANPKNLNAFYNTSDGCSYIYKDSSWELLAKSGANGLQGIQGENGVSIVWKGELASAPTEPELNWAYYNTAVGYSYIWNGSEWEVLAKAGANGTSIIWKGELASAPENPKLYWAYYNTTDGCSYLYNGTAWELLAKAGTRGIAGVNGTSISWLGSFASSSEIANPVNLNAYYNTTDGCSYIYNGTEWQLLARKGSDGTAGSGGSGNGGITWLGDFADSSEITEPEVLSAYYNTTTGCSYIWNGTEWKLLAKGGTDGVNGEGITWMGSLPSDSSIVNPQYMYAYYNTTNGCSYINTGSTWVLLAKAGADGQPYDSSGTTSQGMLPINSAYSIGDVLLNDGTVIPYSANRVFTDEQKRKAVGVMYGNEFGVPSGWLGIYNSCGGTGSATYQWGPLPGEWAWFEGIVCTPSRDNNANYDPATTATFEGDTDGSDNWAYIRSQDSSGANNAAENYPAFYYVTQYASRFYLTGTYASGWYMPSLAELCNLYRNRSKLNSVLNALGGIQLQNADYWSSSQYYHYYNINSGDNALYVNFSNGTIGSSSKYEYKRVCVVRQLVREIDTIAPSSVSNLTGTYNRGEKAITLSWNNPSASDLAYVMVSYTKDGTEIIANAPVFGNASAQASYTVNNAEAVESEYVFTVVAIDKSGNTSPAVTKTITLNNGPKFTTFTIPTVNYLKEGNTVTAIITGKNFSLTSLDSTITFKSICPAKPFVVSNTRFTVINDTVLTATFTIPGKVGEYDITISDETNSITETFYVLDYGDYSNGDVLLNDGTVIHYDENNLTFTDIQKENAVGVLYSNEYGTPLGWVGLHNSGDELNTYKWAEEVSVGDTTMFNDIVCTQIQSGSTTFSGDTDGSDNWVYICDMYPVASAAAATNFPAFDYVNTYANTFGLTGEYAEGWYMPSIAELYSIYKNAIVLNNVIKALDGTDLGSDSNYNYWSSSQSADNAYCAQYINLQYGRISSNSKSLKFLVCCVRPFN